MKFGLPLNSRVLNSRYFGSPAACLALTLSCGLVMMGAATPAHAGFDWTPRANNTAAAVDTPAADAATDTTSDGTTDGTDNNSIAVLPPITGVPPVMNASMDASADTPAPISARPEAAPSAMRTISGTSSAPARVSLSQDGPLTPDPDDDMAAMPLPVPSSASADADSTASLSAHSSGPNWGKETNYFARKDRQPRPEPLDAPIGTSITTPTAQNDTTPLVLSNRPDLTDSPTTQQIQPMADTIIPQGQPIPGDQAILEGFGKDIPLALALRDIVPSQYAFAYANSSYAGLTVSWEGGKPWQDVLNDTLASKGLGANITRNIIYIQPYASSLGTAPLSPPPKTKYEQAASPNFDTANATGNTTGSTGGNATVLKANFKTVWTAKPGYTLREVLENWARVANVQVEWTNPYDYPINDTYSYDGTFARAVAGLITQYNGESPRPVGRLYPNLPKGPSVLVIK